MICKNCGKEISESSKFCGYCGAKVVEQPVQEQPDVVKESIFTKFHFYKSDLNTLWKVAGNPFQASELSFSASVVIVVLNLIANILILRCIICGIGLTIFFVGSIYTYCYLNRKDGQKPEDVYCDVARTIFVPTVFMLLAGVFILFQTLEALWVWAILLSMSFCMGSIFATIKKRESFHYDVIYNVHVCSNSYDSCFSTYAWKVLWPSVTTRI